MVRQLETYSNAEVRRTVRLLRAKHFKITEIHREISTVYGPHSMTRPAILKWCQEFENGYTDLTVSAREVTFTVPIWRTSTFSSSRN